MSWRGGDRKRWKDQGWSDPMSFLLHLSLGALVFVSLPCRWTADSPSSSRASDVAATVATKRLISHWTMVEPLPKPVTNNAVAALTLDGTPLLFSFLGLDESKMSSGISREAFMYNTKTRRWSSLHPVPGRSGRIAATAQAVGKKIYILGGYTVDANGVEVSLPRVDVYDPSAGSYRAGAPMPVAVDDAVSGVWRDRLIYLISGWSQKENVSRVQIYEPRVDQWRQATPIPGPPVFGHAGGIIEDTIIYCDGVKIDRAHQPRFVMSDGCYRGEIHPSQPEKIDWTKLPLHPGGPKYRMAAGVLPGQGLVVFTGGTANPYNYNGIGYNGVASEPSSLTFGYRVRKKRWETLADERLPTMDHRGLVGDGGYLYLMGGMGSHQRVMNQVQRLSVDEYGVFEKD